MFNVTEVAARELIAAAERSQAGELALRVAARRIDDGSIEYGMGFDEQRVDDEAIDGAGVRLLVGAPSRALLVNTTLDYAEVESGRFEFVFVPAAPADPRRPAVAVAAAVAAADPSQGDTHECPCRPACRDGSLCTRRRHRVPGGRRSG
jgi:iron-sulfur cluster assembly protein